MIALIGVYIHVIVVLNPQILGIFRVDVNEGFHDEGLTPVGAIHIAERAEPEGDDISIDRCRVGAVAVFFSVENEL